MTVKDLKAKLPNLDDKATIYVYLEEGADHQFFGIDDVATHTGEPSRGSDGKVGFRFDPHGPVYLAFHFHQPRLGVPRPYGANGA